MVADTLENGANTRLKPMIQIQETNSSRVSIAMARRNSGIVLALPSVQYMTPGSEGLLVSCDGAEVTAGLSASALAGLEEEQEDEGVAAVAGAAAPEVAELLGSCCCCCFICCC
jgi:hypothetical protein